MSVNKAILVGRLGKDPELRYTPSGSAVANFSIATSERWKDKQTGERIEKTEWHNIVAFGKLGEVCGEYLVKGKQVYVEGKIQTEKWTDREGVDRYTTKIIINTMIMLGDKGDSRLQSQPQPQKQATQPTPYGHGQGNVTPPIEDDNIPF